MMPRSYQLPDGRVLFIRRGIGDIPSYMTMYKQPGKNAHRFKSRDLPPRTKADDAQQDLNRYAKKRGLQEYINA